MKKKITISSNCELRKLKNGKYSIRYKIPPHDDVKEWTWTNWYRTNKTSKGAAKRDGEKFRKEKEEELNNYTTKENITLGEYAEQWSEDRKKFNIVKESTWDRDQLKNSCIGNIKLDEIDEDDLENFKRENVDKGYSTDKQNKLIKKVKQIIRHAAKKRKIKHDPSIAVENIKHEIKKKRRALPREKQIQLLNDLEAEEPDGKNVVIRIAFATGMRKDGKKSRKQNGTRKRNYH